MPLIQIDAGTMTKDKKAELIAALTQTASNVLGIPQTAFAIVIRENSLDNFGTGGKQVSELHK